MSFDEDALRDQGYDYQPGEEIERDYHDVLLLSHLENSLSRLNPNLQENTISEAVRKIKNLDQNNLIRNNQEFSRMLHEGVKVAEDYYHAREIYLEAQVYAIGYYEGEGFKVTSEEFMEDGIPHVTMSRPIPLEQPITR